MVLTLKISTTGKYFDKICLEANRDIFCPIGGLPLREERKEKWAKERRLNCLVELTSNRSVRLKIMGIRREPPSLYLSKKSWSSIKSTLRSVLALLIVTIMKRVREIIFLKSNKFTAFKVKDRKEVGQSLMVFNVRKIIHFKLNVFLDLVKLKFQTTKIFYWVLIGLNKSPFL